MSRRIKELNKRFRAARRRGMSLLETAMVIAVVSLLLVFLVGQTQNENDRIRAKNVASKLATISDAAKSYMTSHYAELLAGSGVQVIKAGRTSATGAVPAGSLQALGLLPSGFIDANSYQQHTALLVRKVNSTTIEGMLTTYGGQAIPDRMLGKMASVLGPEGGYVPAAYQVSADSGMVLGVAGGWRADPADWGAAATRPSTGTIQMTMAFKDGTPLKDFLYRNDVGDPEANTMNTAIHMNANTIDTIGSLSGQNDATTGSKTVVVGGTGDPNSLRASIDVWADRNVQATNNVVAGNDVRATNNVRAIGVTDAANQLTGGNVIASNEVRAVGSKDADGNVVDGGNVRAGKDVIAKGDVSADGNVTGSDVIAQDTLMGDQLEVDTSGTVGKNLTVGNKLSSAMLDVNAVVYDSTKSRIGNNGKAFSNGDKLTLGDYLPRMVPQYSYLVRDGQNVYKPTCRGGYSRARVMVYKQTDSVRTANGSVNVPVVTNSDGYVTDIKDNKTYVLLASGITATDNGNGGNPTWTINWVGDNANPSATRQALAQTFCFYD
jgi:type II secretory pathway pseudopilin PulG